MPIWTIFLRQFLGQTELAQCTHLSKNILQSCARASTVGRHRSGNSAGRDQQHAMFWSASHKLPTPMLECGVDQERDRFASRFSKGSQHVRGKVGGLASRHNTHRYHHGAPLLMELVQNHRSQRSLSQESHVKGGSTKLRPESKDISGTRVLFSRMAPRERALVRSYAGSGAGLALRVAPTSHFDEDPATPLQSGPLVAPPFALARVFAFVPVWPPDRSVWPPPSSVCEGGSLGAQGSSRWKAQPGRICREAGGRATSNVLSRDLDLPVPATDGRRLEVVVDGLPLSGGCQLAVDTTLVCALHCDGSPQNGAVDADGVVLQAARRRKERTYPELVGPRSRARLVVLAVEVGSRWPGDQVVPQSKGLRWKGSLLCVIYSERGSSCSIVRLLGRTAFCGSLSLRLWQSLLDCTTTDRGIVCATFCT